MPRITHVKKAQQRYATRPVLNPDGSPKQTPMMKNGVQMTTKHGRPIFLTVTERDTANPEPMPTCDHCRKGIEVGQAYKHMSPKSGPYGGRQLNRHESCPSWQPWEYSSAFWARVAQLTHNLETAISEAELTEDGDVDSLKSELADMVRELASEKEEAADNLEEGFGHETEQSSEIRQQSEDLDSWADELESTDTTSFPEPEAEDCEDCDGEGEIGEDGNPDTDGSQPCPTCDGTGQVTPEEPTADQLSEWAETVRDELMSAAGECPV